MHSTRGNGLIASLWGAAGVFLLGFFGAEALFAPGADGLSLEATLVPSIVAAVATFAYLMTQPLGGAEAPAGAASPSRRSSRGRSPTRRRGPRPPAAGSAPARRVGGDRHPAGRSVSERSTTMPRMQERLLAEKLIGYDTSTPEGIQLCAGFIKGWLEARDIPTSTFEVRGLPIVVAEVGPGTGPVIVIHGHIDVVPGREGQFSPAVEGDRLIGRGAYDMKGAAAAMMLALADLRDQDGRPRPPGARSRRGDRGGVRPRHRRARRPGARRRLRDHRRADRHADRRRREGRPRAADRGQRPRRPRIDALGGRQRDHEGLLDLPWNRVATVRPRSRPSCSTGPRSTSGGSSAEMR